MGRHVPHAQGPQEPGKPSRITYRPAALVEDELRRPGDDRESRYRHHDHLVSRHVVIIRLAKVSSKVILLFLVDGEHPERRSAACVGSSPYLFRPQLQQARAANGRNGHVGNLAKIPVEIVEPDDCRYPSAAQQVVAVPV
jgi:hypothetical protein